METSSSCLPFKADYAKSSRSKCHTTEEAIPAGTLRLATMVKSPQFDGMQPDWNDAKAFMTASTDRKRPQSTDEISGFDDLRPTDQMQIEEWIRAYTDDDSDNNNNTKNKNEDPAKKAAVREQLEFVWKIRDLITGTNIKSGNKPLPNATIKSIVAANQIAMPRGADLVKILADAIIFGVAPAGNSADGCCASRPLRFCPYTCRYVCRAPQAWGECPYGVGVGDIVCKAITIPKAATKNHVGKKWLESVQDACGGSKKSLEPRTRLFLPKTTLPVSQIATPTVTPDKKQDQSSDNSSPKKGTPKPKYSRAYVDPDAEDLVDKHHVLDESFENTKRRSGSSSPDFAEAFPVDLYDAVLCRTDLSRGTNSQYKLQIVVPDVKKPKQFHLWRAWGRVGGQGGGGTKVETFDDREKAKAEFCKLYLKHTGNLWEDRKTFVKHPMKFFQLDVSYADNEDSSASSAADKKQKAKVVAGDPNSKLDLRVQKVVAAMFDKGIAVNQLKSLEVDLAKMPLAKITEAQLKDAYSALKDIEEVLQQATSASNAAMRTGKLQQLSNQFYSKCPSTNPVLIDSMELLKHQIEMVDELISLMASKAVMDDDSTGSGVGTTMAPVDAAYQRLNTELTPMDPNGDAYAMLKKYVENTRNATVPGVSNFGGNNWERQGLRLLDAFEVQREGEADRFAPSKALGNRRLLWHGSRISNYSGILGQGLRIAPPEAPVSGYRFGKGVYFADMLGKSANYCRTSGSSEMFIMACDVSLGKTFETPHDIYMEKPQPGTNSTHALSEIIPNPSTAFEISDCDNKMSQSQHGAATKATDKALVPLGAPIKNESLPKQPSCDVSEFIVYDQSQVQIRFLLRLTTNPNTIAADGSVGATVQSGHSSAAKPNTRSLFDESDSDSDSDDGEFLFDDNDDDDSVAPPRTKRNRYHICDDDDDDSVTPPSKKKRRKSVTNFIRLDREDRSRPSLSGLKLLDCRTFIEGLRLTVVRGDITEATTDAIVVPSDEELSLTGMVGSAVRQKAGPAFVADIDDRLRLTSAVTPQQLPRNTMRLDTTGTGKTIHDLAAAVNVSYLTAFYKVVKKEKISATKDIIYLDGTSGYHRGAAARALLGLHVIGNRHTSSTITPHQIPAGTEVFVQSTSHNRKIPRNSAVLLEMSAVAPATKVPASPLKTSDACVVEGHNLPASQVVFVVSPIFSSQASPAAAEQALKLAVKNTLRECSQLQLETVALPSIGSGRAGYDKASAAEWIIEAIADYLDEASSGGERQSLQEVCFCLFDDESLEAYRRGILTHNTRK